MTRRATTNEKALDAFIVAKAEIDAMLERLAALTRAPAPDCPSSCSVPRWPRRRRVRLYLPGAISSAAPPARSPNGQRRSRPPAHLPRRTARRRSRFPAFQTADRRPARCPDRSGRWGPERSRRPASRSAPDCPKVVSNANPSVDALRKTAISPGQGLACGRRSRGDARLIFRNLRKVQHHHLRRAKDDGAGERSGPRIAGRQVVGCTVLANGFYARASTSATETSGTRPHGRHAQARSRRPDRGKGARAAGEGGTFRPIHASISARRQRRSASSGRDRHREALGGDPGGVDCDPPRFYQRRIIVLIRSRHLPLQRLGQFGLLRADQFQRLAFTACDQIVDGQCDDRGAATHDKTDHAFGLDGIEAEVGASAEIDARGLSSAPIT